MDLAVKQNMKFKFLTECKSRVKAMVQLFTDSRTLECLHLFCRLDVLHLQLDPSVFEDISRYAVFNSQVLPIL